MNCGLFCTVLTSLLPSYDLPLLDLYGLGARLGFEILHKSVRLLYGDLSQLAVFVKDVENVPLGDPVTTQVACDTDRDQHRKI